MFIPRINMNLTIFNILRQTKDSLNGQASAFSFFKHPLPYLRTPVSPRPKAWNFSKKRSGRCSPRIVTSATV